ncbi:MAG TPA: GNAT family N-acetyltransferase [Actinocatenispora sp.]
MISVQVITPDDWLAWREVRLAALKEAPYAYGSTYEDWVDAPEDRWRQRLGGEFHNLLVRIDGRPGGIASGVPAEADDGVVEIVSMYVLPSARGHGVGDRLIGEIADWARTRGASALRLDVTEGNEHATALYRRHGFRDTATRTEPGPHDTRYERTMLLPLA